MASIEKRGSSFRITVSLGQNENGQKNMVRTTYQPKAVTPEEIKAEVEEFAGEFEGRVKRGEYYTGEKITFREYVDVWQREWASQKITLRVMEDYIDSLRLYVLPLIGSQKLSAIRTVQIQKILTDLLEAGKAVKTVRNVFTPINSVFRYAYKMGVLQENPCLRCELPRMNNNSEANEPVYDELHYYDLEQAGRLLAFLEKGYEVSYPERKRVSRYTKEAYSVAPYTFHRDFQAQIIAYFYLAIMGGFRLSEMLGLKWTDVDFKKKTVSITKAISRTRTKGEIQKGPKTRSSRRTINLPDICFRKLEVCKKEQRARMEELGSVWQGKRDPEFDENSIFIQWANGKRMNINTPSDKFEEIVKYYNEQCENEEDKLPQIKLHDLRHTSATILIGENVDIETVSHRLGHSNASVTLDVYAHALPVKDTTASDKLTELFGFSGAAPQPTKTVIPAASAGGITVVRSDGFYVASDAATGITAQGATAAEAITILMEVLKTVT